jgi:hypothetical protein
LTFKDLEKKVSLEASTQQKCRLTERQHNKPFWIWNVEEHKQQDVRTNGDCCFNHIIGLPEKDGVDKPFYDYEGIIFDSLVTQNANSNNTNSSSKHGAKFQQHADFSKASFNKLANFSEAEFNVNIYLNINSSID